MYRKSLLNCLMLLVLMAVASCSTTKYVPEGGYLLDRTVIRTDNKEVKVQELNSYIRQKPNTRWFSLFKVPLATYSLSGSDTTRWINRVLRRIGDAPVIYDAGETEKTRLELEKALNNLGYMQASVSVDERRKNKKIAVTYNLSPGKAYKIRNTGWNIADKDMESIVAADSLSSYIKPGDNFNVNMLNLERQRVSSLLNNNGYYKFNKDFITFTADTVKGGYYADVYMNVLPYNYYGNSQDSIHRKYRINKVDYVTDFDQLDPDFDYGNYSSVLYGGSRIFYKDKLFLRPRLLKDNTFFEEGELYDASKIQNTYSAFGRLGAVKYSNIRLVETEGYGLDAYVTLAKSKDKSVSVELEGTNSAGDFGAAAALAFSHRNAFRSSENFTIRLRGAYEAISGLGEGFMNDNYTEYGVETSLNFPRFIMPFLSSDVKKKIRATSEVGLDFTKQLRPEFERTLFSISWRYLWNYGSKFRHKIDVLDINYVYVPWMSERFEQQLVSNKYSVLRYSYENIFIVSAGYNLVYNSMGHNMMNTSMNDSYAIRFGVESAGNLLNGISHIFRQQKSDGKYSIFKIPYAQYVKGDFDVVKNIKIDDRNSISLHAGLGVAYPFGNSEVLPFEKRYFSGGANSVRGWSVRTLGPGSMKIDDGRVDFMLQSGDIKLDLNVEYRTHLFWKIHGAAFIDAGNIWTFRDYSEQPGGRFAFNRFYKEIAVAYGLGIRFDFNFFVLRFDGGMKAVNPAETGRGRFPLIHPDFSRDFAFHFAVGYPF